MGTAVVTGANRGIGLELARELRARGLDVVAICRKSSPELDALGVRVEAGIDVSKPASFAELQKRFDGSTIDVLINNAGILHRDSLPEISPDSVREQFEVNALGPLLVTQALLPYLHKGSKVGLVTSRMGSIADNTSGGSYGYRMSKAALNAAGVSLALDLKSKGIAVVILHPGFVKTDMTHQSGMVEAADSAKALVARIDELTLETSGRFLHMNGEALPW